jgi:hypothetical protein
MKALVATASGVFAVDVESEEISPAEPFAPTEPVEVGLPRLVAAAASGSTVVAVLDRRPPLAISYDAGATWREAGGGLPAGRAIAIAQDDPDLIIYGARNRLYVSVDGGRFWRVLAPELPEIEAVGMCTGWT